MNIFDVLDGQGPGGEPGEPNILDMDNLARPGEGVFEPGDLQRLSRLRLKTFCQGGFHRGVGREWVYGRCVHYKRLALRAAQGPAAAKALSCATDRATLNELFGYCQGVRTTQCVAQSDAEEMPAGAGLLGSTGGRWGLGDARPFTVLYK
jgi:hypothetical protein